MRRSEGDLSALDTLESKNHSGVVGKLFLTFAFSLPKARAVSRREAVVARPSFARGTASGSKHACHNDPPKFTPGKRLGDRSLHCTTAPFRLFSKFPQPQTIVPVIQEVQAEPVHSESSKASVSAVLRANPVWQAGILAAPLIWLYWFTVVHLVGQWWHDPNFSHGFFVPLFSAYVLWQQRERIAQIRPAPSWSGLVVLLAALGVLIVGRMGAELFLDRSSMLLVLAGVVILFLGWNRFRAVLFPWACLLLMIPIPTILFNQLTFPLQLLVSRVSAAVLELVGVPLVLEGNILRLATGPLNVAEACSGIRSLTFSADPLHHLRLPAGEATLGPLVPRSGIRADSDRRQLCPHHRNRIAGPERLS